MLRSATIEPFTADLRSWRLLTGHSGASVILASRDGSHWFVRKVASDSDDSSRLKAQAAKQARCADARGTSLRTAPVVEEGELDGRYFFEMPFIPGVDGPTFLRRAAYDEVRSFGERLTTHVAEMADEVLPGVASPSFFHAQHAKLCDVQARTGSVDAQSLERLGLALDRVERLGPAEPTRCHGDLTLENLIVDPSGTVWCIDLLDSPFEHYWLDLAKLHQDLAGGWYRTTHDRIAAGVVSYVSKELLDVARQLDDAYPEVHAVLVAMTFVRILPYVDGEHLDFVRQRIAHFATAAHLGEVPPR